MSFQTVPSFLKGYCNCRVSYRAILVFVICLSAFTFIIMFEYTSEYSRTNLSVNASVRSNIKHFNVIRILTNANPEKNQSPSVVTLQPAKGKVKVKGKDTKASNKSISSAVSKTKYAVTLEKGYILENPNRCTSVENLSVLMIVHTAPSHFERRQNIRRTYANATRFQPLGTLRIVFLLGRVKDDSVQDKIQTEFQQHGDILQGDFIDAYKNLTHKGVMAYKWIQERCRNAKVVLKADDDVIINTYMLFTEYLPKFQEKSKSILCNHIRPGTMPILRDRKSKWFVEENEFKGQKFYPRYCSGFFVMITNDIIPDIYKAAFQTPFFWVDDVYLYGLLPTKVKGVTYNGLKRGSVTLGPIAALKCYRNSSRVCNYLVAGASKTEHVNEIWKYMTDWYLQKYKIKSDTPPPINEERDVPNLEHQNRISQQLVEQQILKALEPHPIGQQNSNSIIHPQNS